MAGIFSLMSAMTFSSVSRTGKNSLLERNDLLSQKKKRRLGIIVVWSRVLTNCSSLAEFS